MLREKTREKRKQEKAEEQAREAPLKEIIRNCYQRVAALRKAKDVSVEDYLRACTNYVTSRDAERLPKGIVPHARSTAATWTETGAVIA